MDRQRTKHSHEEISERTNLMYSICQKDLEILRLENEQRQMQQQLVDLEMKMYGRISRQTTELLDAFHCEVLNGIVIKVYDLEKDSVPEIETGRQGAEKGMASSVHGKLNAFKEAEKRQQVEGRIKDSRKRETPELV